jgi:hypothetical protein
VKCSTRSILVLWFIVLSSDALAQEFEAPELLRLYEQTLKTFDKCTFTVTQKKYANHAGAPPDQLFYSDSVRVWRDENRWKAIEESTSRYLQNGQLQTVQQAHEWMQPAKGEFMVGLDKIGGNPKSLLVRLHDLSEGELRRAKAHTFCVVVTGYLFWDQQPLPETLRRATLTAKKVELDRRPVWLLEGRGPWGYHALWLDPAHGFLPRRILARKEGPDLIEIDTDKVTSLAAFQNGDYKLYTTQLDAERFAVVRGREVIAGFTMISNTHAANGDVTTCREIVSFSDINPQPDFTNDPFVLSSRIPDGFHVTVDEKRGINHEWRNGQVEATVNQAAVANLGGNRFVTGSFLRPAVLLLSLLALICLGVAYWFRRRKRV